jgi:hypothetical protein
MALGGLHRSASRCLRNAAGAEFENGAKAAEKAVIENPRFASGYRFLAASRALMGDADGARLAMQQMRELEPRLTVAGLRARLSYMDTNLWNTFSGALRSAGLPD